MRNAEGHRFRQNTRGGAALDQCHFCGAREAEHPPARPRTFRPVSTVADMKVSLPHRSSGAWRVEGFSVSAEEAKFERMRAMIGGGGRGVPEGEYTALYHGRVLVMSDTPDEIRDHMWAIAEARRRGGHVLVNGLGLGMVAAAMLSFENVERVTVIEQSLDVIALVAPTLIERFGERIDVIQADAFEWRPPKGQRYSVVWHDVWNDLCADNLPEMTKLHRRYGRRCDWQGSWGKEWIKAHVR